MKLRIRADLILEVTDSVTVADIRDRLIAIRGKLQKISIDESSFLTVEECNHDEVPPQPCVILYSWRKE